MPNLATKCCCGSCHYVAVRCPCEDESCEEVVYVRCSDIASRLPGTTIVVSDAKTGCCYEIDLTQDPVVDSKPVGPFIVPSRVSASCEECCTPCPPCPEFVDGCDCDTPSAVLLTFSGMRWRAEWTFFEGSICDPCDDGSASAEWEVSGSAVLTQAVFGGVPQCEWSIAPGNTWSHTWQLVSISGCLAGSSACWTTGATCSCNNTVSLPEECNALEASVFCHTIFDSLPFGMPIGRRWGVRFEPGPMMTTGAAGDHCACWPVWGLITTGGTFDTNAVAPLCDSVMGRFQIPLPSVMGTTGSCVGGTKMMGVAGPVASGSACCIEDVDSGAAERLPPDGTWAQKAGVGCVKTLRVTLISMGTVLIS